MRSLEVKVHIVIGAQCLMTKVACSYGLGRSSAKVVPLFVDLLTGLVCAHDRCLLVFGGAVLLSSEYYAAFFILPTDYPSKSL